MSKTVIARDLRDPRSLPESLRRIAKEQQYAERRDIIEHAADELEHSFVSFDIRWNADMRAIKRWQDAHPGKDNVWPDHADLCVWLLGQLPE